MAGAGTGAVMARAITGECGGSDPEAALTTT
jgi:hypothetical protein